MAWILGNLFQTIFFVEAELSDPYLGQIQTQEDVSGVAPSFRWYDPPIYAMSNKIIPGLLGRIGELEMSLAEVNHFEGIHRSYTSAISEDE
ncbi:hypothetical protein QYF36_008116 [Acer negundo]|nr:hypothetical protein QYF36_008116 [Acer negundo]